ncbi:hypothetical protein ACFLRQ_03125 [Bacteroidota bacterium]
MKNLKYSQSTAALLFIVILFSSCDKIPSEPFNPYPADSIRNVDPTNLSIRWEYKYSSKDTILFEVNHGYTLQLEEKAETNLNHVNLTMFESLIADTTYYWQVIAKDNHGNRIEGLVWSFQTAKDTLTIEGKDIWIRDYPATGEVIMKLNTGDACVILEKGELAVIRDNVDYWYKIEFDGKEGWVYGSQTSKKSTNKYIGNELVFKTIEIKSDGVAWEAANGNTPGNHILSKGTILNLVEIGYFGSHEFSWRGYWCRTLNNKQRVWIPGYYSNLIPFSDVDKTLNNKFLEEADEFLKIINNDKITYEVKANEISYRQGEYQIGTGGIIYNGSRFVVFVFTLNEQEDGIKVISYLYRKKDNALIKIESKHKDQNNGFYGYLVNFIDLNNDGQEEFMLINCRMQSAGYYSRYNFFKLNTARNAYVQAGTLGGCSYSEIGGSEFPHCQNVKMKGHRGANGFPVIHVETDDDIDLKESYIWSDEKNEFVVYK